MTAELHRINFTNYDQSLSILKYHASYHWFVPAVAFMYLHAGRLNAKLE
jgi:hypothetical protein